ncbi:hypothetical protein YC2023_110032 [Brassica napus]
MDGKSRPGISTLRTTTACNQIDQHVVWLNERTSYENEIRPQPQYHPHQTPFVYQIGCSRCDQHVRFAGGSFLEVSSHLQGRLMQSSHSG